MIDLIGVVSEWVLDIQEWLFQKKKKKRRGFEKENNQPKKRMLSPYQRLDILVLIVLLVIGGFFFFSKSKILDNGTAKKIQEIKQLLEKEKEFLGSYPKKLEDIIRNNPLNKNLIKDGWNTNFKYELVDNGNSYILFSAGKDRKFNTEDDIR